MRVSVMLTTTLLRARHSELLVVGSLLGGGGVLGAGGVDGVEVDRDLVLAVECDKVGKALEGAVAGELDPVLAAGGLELDGGERLHLEAGRGRDVVGGGVHLGDEHLVLVRLVLFAQLVVGGRELLAVAAPGSVEFDELVLGVVADDGVKLVGDEHVHGAVLVLGHGLRLDRGLEAARRVLGDKVGHLGHEVAREVLERVLEVLLNVLHRKRRPGLALDVERLGVRRVLDGVDPDKVELALVGLGERLERLDLRLEVLGLGVGKEVGERQTGLGVVHKVLGAELTYLWRDNGSKVVLSEIEDVGRRRGVGGHEGGGGGQTGRDGGARETHRELDRREKEDAAHSLHIRQHAEPTHTPFSGAATPCAWPAQLALAAAAWRGGCLAVAEGLARERADAYVAPFLGSQEEWPCWCLAAPPQSRASSLRRNWVGSKLKPRVGSCSGVVLRRRAQARAQPRAQPRVAPRTCLPAHRVAFASPPETRSPQQLSFLRDQHFRHITPAATPASACCVFGMHSAPHEPHPAIRHLTGPSSDMTAAFD
ncbi:hypothetical protein L1887_50315 [Cichorium endivia]|nr:hypothetical protein L1887_50315 [Cichorium endivia]